MRSTIRLPGSKSSSLSPPQGFLQSKNALRRRKTSKSAARQSDRCTSCKPICNCNPERECHQNPQKIISLVRHCMPRTHGIPKGSADPCVFTRQRKIAISSRRLDTALLCAAKKRGVEKGPAGRSLPEPPPGPWTTGPVPKRTLWKSFARTKKFDFSPTGS